MQNELLNQNLATTNQTDDITNLSVQIQNVPVVEIQTNLEAIEHRLIFERDNLKIEVTDESKVKAGKLRASINKLGKEVKEQVERQLEPLTTPIEGINAKVKDIIKITKDIASKIDTEIENVNKIARDNIVKFASEYLNNRYEFHKIESEFQAITVVKLGDNLKYINSKGDNITPSCQQEIENLVLKQKEIQTKQQMRLLNLENACLRVGILPLQRSDVEAFLKEESDVIYEEKLNAIIAKQKAREEEIKRKAEEENARKLEAEKRRIEMEEQVKARLETENKLAAERKILLEQQEKQRLENEAKLKEQQRLHNEEMAKQKALREAEIRKQLEAQALTVTSAVTKESLPAQESQEGFEIWEGVMQFKIKQGAEYDDVKALFEERLKSVFKTFVGCKIRKL